MEYQEAKYIIDYFPRLLTEIEKDTIKYHQFGYTIGNPENDESIESKNLIQNGYEQFVINIGKRIERDSPEEYNLNKCPNCEYLTRTPYAKQ